MKILYYYADYKTAMYQWQHYHIIDELKHHNCNIEVFDLTQFDNIDKANEKLKEKIKMGNYDLFMTDQRLSTLFVETVEFIKTIGIPRILIHFDNLMEPYRHVGYGKYFDAVMLLNKDNNSIYKKYGTKCVFAPYASNPYFFKDLRDNNKIVNKICFAGTPYGTRCIPLNMLLRNELNVDLYANSKSIEQANIAGASLSSKEKISILFNKMRYKVGRKIIFGAIASKFKKNERLLKNSQFLSIYDAVSLTKTNELYSNYSLSISMPEARNTGYLKRPVNIVHLRNFEIPMSAGLQISRYMPELAEYFEEDKEIVFYRNAEELCDKVKWYTDPSHQGIVNTMKTNARNRAENEHTWYKRFKKVFNEIGLDI